MAMTEAERERHRAYHRERNARQRAQVIAGYGGCCACCGENTPEFLGIDHIGGRGDRDRRPNGQPLSGCKLYARLIRRGFPSEYRLLCHNCNLSLGHWGYCPHGLVSTGRKSGDRIAV